MWIRPLTLSACCILASALAAADTAPTTVDLWNPDTPHLLHVETRSIDFTTPDSYACLGAGWHDELGRTQILSAKNALGALSIVAELNLEIHRPRDMKLMLSMLPRYAESFGAQRVTVAWNNHRLGDCEFDLEQGWQTKDFVLDVPARVLRPGANTLQFLSRYAVSAKDLGAGNDPRVYAFGLLALRLEPDTAAPEETPITLRYDGDTLIQPPNSRLVFPMPPATAGPVVFESDGVEGDAQVLVRWDQFGGPRIETPKDGASGPFSFSPPAEQPYALVLTAEAEAVRWTRPRLHHSAAAPDDPQPSESTPTVDNVVLVIFDALRGDRVGYAPYPRETTPFLDSLAARGRIYARAYSAAPYTYSSTWSLLTGLFPFQHGATGVPRKPAPGMPRLPVWISEGGIVTACIAANPYLTPGTGIPEGFDVYASGLEELPPPQKVPSGISFHEALQGKPELVTQASIQFLNAHANERFLLYAHYRQPHAPYYATDPWFQQFSADPDPIFPPHAISLRQVTMGKRPLPRETLQHLNARYDENLRVADEELRTLWRAVESAGVADRTALIVTSDHGESFMEHGILSHSQAVYNAEVHIPLMILLPPGIGEEPQVIRRVVSGVDLFPTIAALLGLPRPDGVMGNNLLAPAPPESLGTVRALAQSDPESVPWEGYFFDRYKLIRHRYRHAVELYDLEMDPHETSDLAATYPVLTEYLLAQAMAWKSAHAIAREESGQSDALEDDIVEQLEALGYVN